MKLTLFIALALSTVLYSWSGNNSLTGEDIEIEKGNLVRSGRDIDVYHSLDNEYRTEEVDSISSDELVTYDYETGEYNYYDMD